MLKKFLLIFVSFFAYNFNAQDVLGHYPLNQHPYVGGQDALDKDLVAVFKDLSLTDCPTQEEYEMPVLVEADSSIKFVKDFDSINVNKNKCAFDIGRKLVPNLKRWLAARIDGKFYPAIARIKIVPYFLANSKENPKDNIITSPTIKGGISVFSEKIHQLFSRLPSVKETQEIVLGFVVDENGKMKDFEILDNYQQKGKEKLISDLEKLNVKWIPGSFNAKPKSFKMRQVVIRTP